MNPRELVASSTQFVSSVPGPSTQPSLPLVGELTEKLASRAGASTVSAAVRVAPLNVALIVDEALLDTVDVLMVNDALDCPPTTITVAGTCATVGLLLVSVTTTPLDGADWVSVSEAGERRDGRGPGCDGLLGDGLGAPEGSGEVGEPLPHPATTVPV